MNAHGSEEEGWGVLHKCLGPEGVHHMHVLVRRVHNMSYEYTRPDGVYHIKEVYSHRHAHVLGRRRME